MKVNHNSVPGQSACYHLGRDYFVNIIGRNDRPLGFIAYLYYSYDCYDGCRQHSLIGKFYVSCHKEGIDKLEELINAQEAK